MMAEKPCCNVMVIFPDLGGQQQLRTEGLYCEAAMMMMRGCKQTAVQWYYPLFKTSELLP